MKATIAIKPTALLRHAKFADLFIVHMPGLDRCVCIWVQLDRVCGTVPDGQRLVCVIASEDGADVYDTGLMCRINDGAPITFVEAIEPVAFRERQPMDDIERYLVATERVFNAVANTGARCRAQVETTYGMPPSTTAVESPTDHP